MTTVPVQIFPFPTTDVESLEQLQQTVAEWLAVQSAQSVVITLILTSLAVTVGQSLLLLANQVRPSRFFFSLFFSALTFAASLGVWTAAVYSVGRAFFQITLSLWEIFVIVVLSFAPLTQAYLGILPYLGSCIVRFLYVQSAVWLYVFLALTGYGWRGALLVLLLGAVVLLVAQFTVLYPLYWLQDKVAGTQLKRRYRDIIQGARFELER